MEFCYQLSKSPPTYDFLIFLWYAEQTRKQYGKQSLQIRIVPGDRLRVERDLHFSEARKTWRAQHLLYDLAWLMPSVTDVSVSTQGIQTVRYNMPGLPMDRCLKSSAGATECVKRFLSKHRNPVCIPIRYYDYQTDRNTIPSEWRKVVSWLKSNGYTPISVQDTEGLMAGVHCDIGAIDYYPASMSPDLRLALYEQCVTNLILNQGPAVLGLIGNADCFVFFEELPQIESCTRENLKKTGFFEDWGPGRRTIECSQRADDIIAHIEPRLSEAKAA